MPPGDPLASLIVNGATLARVRAASCSKSSSTIPSHDSGQLQVQDTEPEANDRDLDDGLNPDVGNPAPEQKNAKANHDEEATAARAEANTVDESQRLWLKQQEESSGPRGQPSGPRRSATEKDSVVRCVHPRSPSPIADSKMQTPATENDNPPGSAPGSPDYKLGVPDFDISHQSGAKSPALERGESPAVSSAAAPSSSSATTESPLSPPAKALQSPARAVPSGYSPLPPALKAVATASSDVAARFLEAASANTRKAQAAAVLQQQEQQQQLEQDTLRAQLTEQALQNKLQGEQLSQLRAQHEKTEAVKNKMAAELELVAAERERLRTETAVMLAQANVETKEASKKPRRRSRQKKKARKAENEKWPWQFMENPAKVEAENKLKEAMPWPWQAADPTTLQPAIEVAKRAGVSATFISAAEAKLREAKLREATEKPEADAIVEEENTLNAEEWPWQFMENPAKVEAESRLKVAMPWPWQAADPTTLRPAIKAAKEAGVTAAIILVAEAKLQEAIKNPNRRAAEERLKAAMPTVFQPGYPQHLSDALDAAREAGVDPDVLAAAEAALAALKEEAWEIMAVAKAKAEADAIKEAETKLKAAMPLPFKRADSAKLKPAIEAARASNVSEARLASAEAALQATLDHAQKQNVRAADAALKAAMPLPFKRADSEKLKPAIAEAKKAGASDLTIAAAEAKLGEAVDCAKKEAEKEYEAVEARKAAEAAKTKVLAEDKSKTTAEAVAKREAERNLRAAMPKMFKQASIARLQPAIAAAKHAGVAAATVAAAEVALRKAEGQHRVGENATPGSDQAAQPSLPFMLPRWSGPFALCLVAERRRSKLSGKSKRERRLSFDGNNDDESPKRPGSPQTKLPLPQTLLAAKLSDADDRLSGTAGATGSRRARGSHDTLEPVANEVEDEYYDYSSEATDYPLVQSPLETAAPELAKAFKTPATPAASPAVALEFSDLPSPHTAVSDDYDYEYYI